MTIRAVRPRLVDEIAADVVVVGGGIAGLIASLELVRAGRDVVLLDAATVDSSATGYAVTGLASGTYADAITRLGADAARELWQTSREGHRLLLDLARERGVESGDTGAGGFLLARSRAEAVSLADSEDALRDDGFVGEFLDNYMLSARFDVDGPYGALWVADDALLSTGAIAARLVIDCEQRGVRVFEGTAVTDVQPAGDTIEVTASPARVHAAQVIITGDAATRRLAPAAGAALTRDRWRTLRHAAGSPRLPTPARTVDGRIRWAFSGGTLAGLAHGDEDPAALLRSWVPLANWSGVATDWVDRWSTRDGLPLVGANGSPRIQVACGDAGAGPGLAALAGRWTAQAVLGHDAAIPPRFRASR